MLSENGMLFFWLGGRKESSRGGLLPSHITESMSTDVYYRRMNKEKWQHRFLSEVVVNDLLVGRGGSGGDCGGYNRSVGRAVGGSFSPREEKTIAGVHVWILKGDEV